MLPSASVRLGLAICALLGAAGCQDNGGAVSVRWHIVDLTTGVSRVESAKNGQGRVQGLFQPGSGAIDLKTLGGGAQPPKPAPARPLN